MIGNVRKKEARNVDVGSTSGAAPKPNARKAGKAKKTQLLSDTSSDSEDFSLKKGLKSARKRILIESDDDGDENF